MRKANAILVPLCFLLLQTFCLAQTEKRDEKTIKSIEEYAKSVDDFIEKEGKPHLVIADFSDYNDEPCPVWRKFDSQDEFEKTREEEETYTVAFVWNKEKKPVAVNFTYSSPSGDWAQYVFYVFREDGTVARADRELRTFLGDLIINRVYLFDDGGRLVKETKRFRDLNSGKDLKPSDDFMDIEVEIYKKVKELPFADLLSPVGVIR